MLRFLAIVASLLLASPALGASCFWVGGTGTTSDATKWSSSSGGAGSTCAGPGGIPDSSDTATWDGSSGGGTVTVAAGATWTLQSVALGAFTGTWTNATNNRNITVTSATGFVGSGSGTRTINLGTATYTISSATGTWNFGTATNLTCTCSTANIVFAGGAGAKLFQGGGQSHGNVTFGATTGTGYYQITGANTFASLTPTAPNMILFPQGVTTTVTAALNWVGNSSNQTGIQSASLPSQATIAVAANSTITWTALRDMAFTGSPLATSSYNLGNNSGITITGPVATGSGIIGG